MRSADAVISPVRRLLRCSATSIPNPAKNSLKITAGRRFPQLFPMPTEPTMMSPEKPRSCRNFRHNPSAIPSGEDWPYKRKQVSIIVFISRIYWFVDIGTACDQTVWPRSAQETPGYGVQHLLVLAEIPQQPRSPVALAKC